MASNYVTDRNKKSNCVPVRDEENLIDEFTNDVRIKKAELIPDRDKEIKYFPIRGKANLIDKPEVNKVKII